MSRQGVDELTKTVAGEPDEPEMRGAETSGIPANKHAPQPPLPSRAHAMNLPAHRPKSCKPI
jgi:hypothetical protein